MQVYATSLDRGSERFRRNRAAMLERLEEIDRQLALARGGGGERYVARHRQRGKLLVRERLDLLVDRDRPFLELSPPGARGAGGADRPTQAEIFVPGGRTFFEITRLSAERIPTLSLVFGSCTAGGAYVPGMSDYTIFIKERSKVFLAGPPLVKMATGEESAAIRSARGIAAHLNGRKHGPGPSLPADPPLHDAEDLLGIASVDLREAFDMREIIARVVDGSRIEEFKPLYGRTLVTAWASIHGYPVGLLANNGVLFSEESEKAAQFIQLANQHDVPLVFLQNITGYMVGRAYERGGIIKDGAKMINDVTNSKVPHVTLMIGASYGACNYGMSGRAYDPRFVFTWPSHRIAVMGPRDTRTVLCIALSACHSAEVLGAGAFGVFRM